MQVTVIDSKRIRAITCSFAEAARIIGISAKTISRWSIIKRAETYNQFTVYFDCHIKKQPLRNTKRNSIVD